MAKNKDPRYYNSSKNGVVILTDTTPNSFTFSSTSDGVYIMNMHVVNVDASSKTILLQITDVADTVVSHLGMYTIPASAGYVAGTAVFDLKNALEFLDIDGAENKILMCEAGYKIRATMTGSGTTYLNIQYGEYRDDS